MIDLIQRRFLPFFLLFLFSLGCITCTVPPQPSPGDQTEEPCAYAVSYIIDGVAFAHTETAIRADIWPADTYAVHKKVYSVWTDQAPQFFFYTSASKQDEISSHTDDWQSQPGTRLNLNSVGLESAGLTFKIEQEAFKAGDILKISFSGTTAHGLKVTDGLICATIDVVQENQ